MITDSCDTLPHIDFSVPFSFSQSYLQKKVHQIQVFDQLQTIIITMASLGFLAAAITTTLVISSTMALPPNKPTAQNPATSAAFPPNPSLSPYSELSPDIAPLLPSTGGAALPPTGSIMPTIPSTRSPPNPDITGSTGLDTTFGLSGSFQDSSAVSQILVKGLGRDAFPGFLAFWLVLVFIV